MKSLNTGLPTAALKTTGLVLAMAAATFQAHGATIVIDDMSITQGNAGAPAASATQGTPNDFDTVPGPTSNIWGGFRHIGVHWAAGVETTSTFVSGTPKAAWQVQNPVFQSGWGEINWNGNAALGGFSATPLDLSQLQYFNIQFVSADHPTIFYMEVSSGPNNCSQAILTNQTLTPGEYLNIQVLPGQFTGACQTPTAGTANFGAVSKIRIFFNPTDAIDTALYGVSAVVNEPPVVKCDYKLLSSNGTQFSPNLQVGTTEPPYNLTVKFSVSNSGGSASRITVFDSMPPGMTPTSPISCTSPSAAFSFGGPTAVPPTSYVWDSTTTSMLGAGESAVCTFTTTLTALDPGQTKTNTLEAGVLGEHGPEQCLATITRDAPPPPPPRQIPTMNEWAMMLTAALLALLGGLTLRRKEA